MKLDYAAVGPGLGPGLAPGLAQGSGLAPGLGQGQGLGLGLVKKQVIPSTYASSRRGQMAFTHGITGKTITITSHHTSFLCHHTTPHLFV